MTTLNQRIYSSPLSSTSLAASIHSDGIQFNFGFYRYNYTLFTILWLTFTWFIKPCHGKGGAVGAAAAAGGATAGVDWTAGGNYTEEEMVVALIVVGIIMSVSLLICACQCYQKVLWEIENTHLIVNKVTKRPMPPAPYNRDAMA